MNLADKLTATLSVREMRCTRWLLKDRRKMWFVADKRDVHEVRMVVLGRYCARINKQVRTGL
jgi:hypothetical protein